MRRLFGLLLVAAVCGAAFVLAAATGDGVKTLKTYDIVVDNAFGLVEGGDLKIGGVKAGQTTGFRLTRSEPYRTIVTAEVSEPGFASLRTDAECEVRAQSLIGEYFVDCDLGEDKTELKDGGQVPVENTASTIPPDLINNVMRRPYRERFRLILSELGTGLAGRPEDLNEVIRRAHPSLRELTETLAILRRQNTIISDFIRDADTVSAAVEPFKEDVARWANESEDVASIQASRSEQLGRYYNKLPEFLDELRPTLAELEATADEQIPTLQRLQSAAPDLQRFLEAAQPFARNTRGALGPLGRFSDAGSSAIGESREEIAELRRLARLAPRLAKPLRQFLQTIDDRKRSTENDPQAASVAPPAPDKTAYKRGQGFTGMEGLFNYFYQQTLAINATDELGHLLRIVLIAGGPCAGYSADPTPEEIKQCNSWLGPNQPGVDGQAEPTSPADEVQPAPPGPGGPSSVRSGQRTRGAAEPEAPPAPGERDLSKPQITLPDGVRKLLGGLRGPKPAPVPQNLPVPGGESAPKVRSGAGTPFRRAPDPAISGLLDYLLAP